MIPSMTSLLLPNTAATTGSPSAADNTHLALPLVPVFMLGDVKPTPLKAPQLPITAEGAVSESSDPEQLMQLLLDPTLMAPMIQQPLSTPLHPQLNAAVPKPELATVTGSPLLPPSVQSTTLAGQLVTPNASVPLQPFKLRTPQDAREASQQVLIMMQAQPDEPLAKMLPQQIIAQIQPQFLVNPAGVAATAKSALPLTLPEGVQEKAAVLREALGDRLQLQIDQRSQKATIRLDPPNLGKLDISLHYEGGKLQVQIQAAQPEVYRALQQVSQELRGALSEQNQIAVNVQVSQQQQQGEQRHAPQQQPAQDTVLSNNIAEVTEEQRHRDLSILTTV